MVSRVVRSFKEPDRECSSYDERWNGEDRGLILSWEIGRKLRVERPSLAECARNGELPVLGWKGGVDKQRNYKSLSKYGTLYYLAQWQGLRGDDLDIDWSEEPQITCAATGFTKIFTANVAKYAPPEQSEEGMRQE